MSHRKLPKVEVGDVVNFKHGGFGLVVARPFPNRIDVTNESLDPRHFIGVPLSWVKNVSKAIDAEPSLAFDPRR